MILHQMYKIEKRKGQRGTELLLKSVPRGTNLPPNNVKYWFSSINFSNLFFLKAKKIVSLQTNEKKYKENIH